MEVDVEKARREGMRWYLLLAMKRGEPIGCGDAILKSIVDDIYGHVSVDELHVQLSFLEKSGLVVLEKSPKNVWHGVLTADGVNFVEYAIADMVGISRPQPAERW